MIKLTFFFVYHTLKNFIACDADTARKFYNEEVNGETIGTSLTDLIFVVDVKVLLARSTKISSSILAEAFFQARNAICK